MTDANDLPKHGARITFSAIDRTETMTTLTELAERNGLGIIWIDEAGNIDPRQFEAVLSRGSDAEWIEFGEPRVPYEPGDLVEANGEIFEAKSIGERIADKAAETAVREAIAKLYDDPRPTYRRIEFGGRHGGKMMRLGLRK